MSDVSSNDIPPEGGGEELELPPGVSDGLASNRNFSAPPGKLAKKQWRTAALKAKELPDPWEGYE